MVHLSLTLFPALLLGVAGTLAANTAPSTQPTTDLAGGGITHHTLLPDASTPTPATTQPSTNPNPAQTADTDTDIDPNPDPEIFNTVQRRLHRCWRDPLKCDCSKNATELAALNALRAEKYCPNCTCVDGHSSGAEGGPAAAGQLVAVAVAAVVGVAAVMVLL
ncbi:hypothetical protein B0I37DRAFT_411417 [Chaetomium sp. MPI-CAGE-AT-0009]|nr:hypothetical protein B0I37DRAFT_411417 [Chaetomium sp. MPI-CAGE-AT-0009]